MLITTSLFFRRARRRSVRCPSCKAPIVGTKPMERFFRRAFWISLRTASMVVKTRMQKLPGLFVQHFLQRFHDKGAFEHSRMRDRQTGRLEFQTVVKQDVDVDGPRSVGHG